MLHCCSIRDPFSLLFDLNCIWGKLLRIVSSAHQLLNQHYIGASLWRNPNRRNHEGQAFLHFKRVCSEVSRLPKSRCSPELQKSIKSRTYDPAWSRAKCRSHKSYVHPHVIHAIDHPQSIPIVSDTHAAKLASNTASHDLNTRTLQKVIRKQQLQYRLQQPRP